MFFQREEADAVSKQKHRKEQTIPSRSFIIAREEIRWDRDKQRRETHNKIEKKRRTFINAKIAELGNMLPDHIDRTSCNKKGTILKEAVEYMKKLQRDQELLKQLEIKIKYLDIETRRMVERLQSLEDQPVTNITHCSSVEMEATPAQTIASSGVYQTNSKSESQMFYRQTANTTCSRFTSEVMTTCTQPDKLNTEWNSISSLERADDTVCFESSPTFADTLINYF